ncbi:MAG TPA: non-ribosomal peptide synthetase [Bacteroidota bacterium]|nr:non-ribosomal peptide synthetase [Bacteroidota bacterium]
MYVLFERRAALSGGATALGAPGSAHSTFGDCHALIRGVRGILSAKGVARSERVAVSIPTSAERLVIQTALSTWCTAVPLNPALRAGEIESVLKRLGLTRIIAPAGPESPAAEAARNGRIECLDVEAIPGAQAGRARLAGCDILNAPAAGESHARPAEEDIAFILQTSGTTGTAKFVPLTHANVTAGATNIAGAMRLGSSDTLLALAQLHHIAGISLALAALDAGGSVFCTAGFHAPDFFPWLEASNPTWIWAAPAMLHEIVARASLNGGALPSPRLRLIRVGSAPLGAKLKADVEEMFRVPVLENYGMTEAAPQIASVPLPPARQKPGTVGIPVGIEIAIIGERGELLPPGLAGEIAVRGPSVMKGYLGGEEVNRESFVNGWFRTGDQGYLDGEGYLTLTGRIREIINRGGEKISPLEVDAVLLNHPSVSKAVTFPVPHPALGEEVAAAVVLRPGANATEQEIQEFVVRELSVAKVPRHILFVPEIPSDGRGKVRRASLAGQLGLRASPVMTGEHPATGSGAPATQVERELAVIWQDVLKLQEGALTVDSRFLDVGGDSVSAVLISSRVRGAFSVELSPVAFFEAPTIAGLARLIESKREGNR